MIRERLAFVAEATCGKLAHDRMFAGVSTDTRRIASGNLFVPLRGERFDGHDYVRDALARGAWGFLWQDDRPVPDDLQGSPHVVVKDTLRALQDLAAAYRRRLSVKVIAVTGSNGKTSTKDMIAAVLARSFVTAKTHGNFNNHIGLPLSILAWTADTQVAVLEMGMRGFGEIALLCQIAQPDIGVITHIGEAHLGMLGSRDGIARAKWELIESLRLGGLAILPADEPLIAELPVPPGVQVMTFGESPHADLQMEGYQLLGDEGASFILAGSEERVEIPVPGRHQARNALCAIAVADAMRVSRHRSIAALMGTRLSSMRLEVSRPRPDVIMINDAYNAAPASMIPALEILRDLDVEYRVAVIGDMLELGETADQLHQDIGSTLSGYGVDELIAVGDIAANYVTGALSHRGAPHMALHLVRAAQDALSVLEEVIARRGRHRTRGAVLLKGSRAIGLDQVAYHFTTAK